MLAQDGVALRIIGGPAVAQQAAEDVAQEIGQELLFPELVDPVRRDRSATA